MNQYENEEIGTVKCYFPLKGFGFITRPKGKDHFFFYKDVKDEAEIFEGAKVAFTSEKDPKGFIAKNIRRIG